MLFLRAADFCSLLSSSAENHTPNFPLAMVFFRRRFMVGLIAPK